MSFDELANRMFSILSLSLLLDIIGHHSHPVAPLFLPYADCGKDWFSLELARFRHQARLLYTP
ncbi:hypothetical protein C6W10_36835 [Plantactinospora sp. BB1]|nr:hypothetical protein C6W10_36835 [Plantactinospora sp. BB1]